MSLQVPCTGVPLGRIGSGGPRRPGGPAPASRTMRPPVRTGLQGRVPCGTRLVREEGVPVAWLVSLAGCHAGSEDPYAHGVKAVQELNKGAPSPPLAPVGAEIGPPFACRMAHGRRSQVGDRRRRIAEPRAPCHSGTFPLRAVPPDVVFVLVCRAAMGARGVCPHAVAHHQGCCPHVPGHEATQKRLLQLRGGCPHCRTAALRPPSHPVPQS